jgi:hypothetical protein
MIQNVGYKFSTSSKTWMAAFLMNAIGAIAPAAATPPQYELLKLPEVEKREQLALGEGDVATALEFRNARIALEETAKGLRATPSDLPPDFSSHLYTRDNDGDRYKVINPGSDVDWTEFFIAQKTAQVKAEKVPPGTVVETILASGKIETTKTAGENGGYRVTNPTGEQYLVDTAKFEKIYEAAEVPGMFKPKPDPRRVIRIGENVAFTAPWGEEMRIAAGGVLVMETPRKVYGIQPDEFKKTYG